MNIYFYVVVAVSLLILIGACKNGYDRGFSREIGSLVKLAAMVLVVVLIGGIASGRQAKDAEDILFGFIGLLILSVVYKLLSIVLGGLHLISKLPLLATLDSILGAVLGFLEGFVILYLLEYLLRNVFLGGV